MPTVLTVGSLHYDIMVETDHLPQKDETAVGTRWYPKFGGKGGNQAVSAAKAGATSRILGAVGDDDFGRFLRAALRAGQVDDRFVSVLTGTGSGISVALQDSAGDYAATIVSGANLLISHDALTDPALWERVGVLVLQNEVTADLNLAAASQARARGLRTLLNAAPYRPLSPDLQPLIDILVVNAVEAEMMGAGKVGSLDSAKDAAMMLAGRFESVIVTAGAAGLAGCGGAGEVFTLNAETVQVVSSHGAGDAFIGTLAAQIAGGAALEPACRIASQAAARHVAGLG